jgi:hypothetical protein
MLILSVALPAGLAAQTQEKPKEPPKEISVSGSWDMTIQTPQGERPTTVTFTQEKEAVKVSMTGPEGMTINGEGTIKESAIQWTLTISGPNGDFTLFFKGKVEGESMTGELQMGDFGTATWSAKKKK